ncbi:hypothetical protein CHUAL_008252 [Chamberlinius hualienensis]
MKITIPVGLFYCVVGFFILKSPTVAATFLSLANTLTGSGGYGGGGYGYANYEMAPPPPPPPPKPTLGRMIGDKIDGISNLKSMLFGPLLNLATALLMKGGGGMAAPAPAPAPVPAPAPASYGGGGGGISYSGGGSMSVGGGGSGSYGSSVSSPSASYTSGGQLYNYGSSGSYSNTNPVTYLGKTDVTTASYLADKYRHDATYSASTSDEVQQLSLRKSSISGGQESSIQYYQPQVQSQLHSNDNYKVDYVNNKRTERDYAEANGIETVQPRVYYSSANTQSLPVLNIPSSYSDDLANEYAAKMYERR